MNEQIRICNQLKKRTSIPGCEVLFSCLFLDIMSQIRKRYVKDQAHRELGLFLCKQDKIK